MIVDSDKLQAKLELLEAEDMKKEEYYRLHSSDKDWDNYKEFAFQSEWDVIRDKIHVVSSLLSNIKEAQEFGII